MGLNCKPGDLAVMVQSGLPRSVGLIVEVVEPCAASYAGSYGHIWACRTVTGATSDQGYCFPGQLSDIPDAWLRPIKGTARGMEAGTAETEGLGGEATTARSEGRAQESGPLPR